MQSLEERKVVLDVQALMRMTRLRPPLAQEEVGEDSGNPAGEPVAVPKRGSMEPRPGDGLGRQVFRVLPVPGQPAGQAEQLRQGAEGGLAEPPSVVGGVEHASACCHAEHRPG